MNMLRRQCRRSINTGRITAPAVCMKTIRTAFVKSLPVMGGYVILGIGFGILAHNAGYGFPWALAMSLLIFAGSMQYVGIGLLAGGASVLTVILTTVMVNARHLFYSISMLRHYRNAGRYKPYLIFALTDETYSLLCDGKTPEGADPPPVPLPGVPVQPFLLGAGQRHRQPHQRYPSLFHGGD